ncbi:PadR family transcriptional regulator [Fulvivirgaceae bacterium BMA12]|uniref:PadR family transcriptional regulator n=1 Tax=Agaribacillus aureus TaxID=3051825 RepID=A0ABT8L3S7_9BACT|nr:PadR family transcriptional regulator [Fulvivirgaceae bacterium BMA12]
MNRTKSTMRITHIDYTILGLLKQQPGTAYGIRKIFETTALGNFSSSPGTIYPAVRKLKKLGFVVDTDKHKRGSTMKLTDAGIAALKKWLLLPVKKEDITRNTNLLILRFAFMDDLIDMTSRVGFLEGFVHQVTMYLEELNIFYQKNADTLPVQGRIAFEHGLMQCQAHLKWGIHALKTLKVKGYEN